MKIEIVPPHFTDRAWADGADCLSEACDKSYDEVTGSQLKMLISRGERILGRMVNEDETVGWACGEIIQRPNIRTFHITSLVCHNGNYQSFFDEVKNMAKSTGCSCVTYAANDSVARLHSIKLKDENIEKMYSIYRVMV